MQRGLTLVVVRSKTAAQNGNAPRESTFHETKWLRTAREHAKMPHKTATHRA